MARLLSISDYGILGALFYLVYILGIFGESIQNIFAKTSATEKDNGYLKNITKRFYKKIGPLTGIFFIFYLLLGLLLYYLKDIPYTLIIINGLFIFILLFLPITRGILQGKKKFYSLGFNLITESSIKVLLSIILVLIGWRVYGAIIGAVLGTFLALIFSFAQIKNVVWYEEKKAEVIKFKEDSKSVFLVTFPLLAFYTIDIFIAQLVFDKQMAGFYTIAAILSKAIFWGTQPISKAMFPITTEKSQNQEDTRNIYLNAFILLFIIAFIGLILFYFFPDFIIEIFSGKNILESSSILFYLGLSTAILSFANLNILHKVSKKNPKNPYVFFILLAISIILLFIFHSSLKEFSLAFLVSSLLFLIGSIILHK
ncbi:oligosaccharide flippase family protein [Candidatus Pacearchaeota archaeon]|nr:oligosaccharide flippase family protein [Candidatus Pacearchaeota archaeon]